MKRILAFLLCLGLMVSLMTACKPDNITYPSEITDPDENLQEDVPVSTTPKEDPEEAPEETDPEVSAPAAPVDHPFTAKGFKFSTGVGTNLPIGGFIKDTAPADALKEQTVSLYTAREEAAFNYVNKKGATVSEWDWMKALAEKYGFTLKLSVKSADLSLKSQRVALMAGKELSVLQLRKEDLAQGLTLARSAGDKLDKSIATFGISKAVLEQSNDTLFAPVGYADTLWYNTALMPEGTDPAALAKEGKWTVDAFKTVFEYASEKELLPLQMGALPWVTLSGKNPLTLKDGKLDHNFYAKDTRDAFEKIRAVFTTLPDVGTDVGTTYDLKFGNTAMTYTALPERGEKVTVQYVPLPTLEEGATGTATFAGTFMALPKYVSEEKDASALAFIELWCNRFTEAHAAALRERGMTIENYVNYTEFTEQNGYLILYSPEIETLTETYLSGLSDAAVDMEKEYAAIKTDLSNLITRYNVYY